jgi:hypothetical protein
MLVFADAGVAAGGESSEDFDGEQAYRHLKQICRLGPRPSGSAGMKAQQELVSRHFAQFGGAVEWQRFRAPHPLGGSAVPMANLICRWHPDRADRILLCAHYDTRPLPDQDPNPVRRRTGVFLGANDGASGVAVLMAMAEQMSAMDVVPGVDFVLFDGEEFVFRESHPYFLGSEWFSRKYVQQQRNYAYRCGVLLDMVGDADLQIHQERYSMDWPESRALVSEIWETASRLGVEEFIARPKYAVRDDHLNLRNIAQIPTCNVIDFDYPFWHTEADTPAKCSAQSLSKVGRVVCAWLRSVE